MLNNNRNAILLLAVLAVAGIGVAALIHHNEVSQVNQPVAYSQPAAYAPQPNTLPPAQAQQPYQGYQDYQDYQVDGYYASSPRPIYVQPPAPAPAPAAVQPAYTAGSYYAPQPVYRERYEYRRGHRSRKHSIEIVAGSAAAGAAIGAIAGGGPGAAIGAIAGGAGGFAYDRATHRLR